MSSFLETVVLRTLSERLTPVMMRICARRKGVDELVLLVVLGIEWFYDVDDWSFCQPPLRREIGGFQSGFSFP